MSPLTRSAACAHVPGSTCALSRLLTRSLVRARVRSARVTNKRMDSGPLVVTVIGPDGEDVITVDQRQLYRCALRPHPRHNLISMPAAGDAGL